jgi:hypothetical protein
LRWFWNERAWSTSTAIHLLAFAYLYRDWQEMQPPLQVLVRRRGTRHNYSGERDAADQRHDRMLALRWAISAGVAVSTA